MFAPRSQTPPSHPIATRRAAPRRARSVRRVAVLVAAGATVAGLLPTAAGAAAPTRAESLDRGATEQVLLALRAQSGLQRFVRSVSDPSSPDYRHYATVERLAARYGATPRSKRAVTAWLGARRLHATVGPTGTYVVASGTAAQVGRALGGGVARAASAGAALPVPAGLRGSVTGVALLSRTPAAAPPPSTSPRPRAYGAGAAAGTGGASGADISPAQRARLRALIGSGFVRTGTPAGCAAGRNATVAGFSGFTPNQYLTAYGQAALHARGLRGEGERVAVLETDGFNPSDVATFGRCFGVRVPPIQAHAVGLRRFPAAGDETTLDLEVLSAAAPGLRGIHVYASPGTAAGLLGAAAAAIANPRTRPNVISISLGICEPGLTGEVIGIRALEDVFEVAAGAGISVLASSGDSGSAACASPQAKPPLLAVNVPAALPSVTAVGGTNLQLTARNTIASEVAWNDAPATLGATGGGLSVIFDRPWWQRGPGLTPSTGNDVTRAVPDVAALADLLPGYAIFCTAADCDSATLPSGGWQTFGGTSAATPLTAAGIALADQEARLHGQRPLGFANPLIYSLARGPHAHAVLNDVTSGSNDVGVILPSDAGGGTPLGAFSSSRSYDPVTGWGSLKLAAFSRQALAAARATP